MSVCHFEANFVLEPSDITIGSKIHFAELSLTPILPLKWKKNPLASSQVRGTIQNRPHYIQNSTPQPTSLPK